MGTVSTDHTRTLLARGVGLQDALMGGYHLAFRIGVGCAVVALITALVVLRAPRPRAAASEPALSAESS